MGNSLLETLVIATGLPEGQIRAELQDLMHKYGKNADTLTMDDLRELMAEYLQDVLLAAKETLS